MRINSDCRSCTFIQLDPDTYPRRWRAEVIPILNATWFANNDGLTLQDEYVRFIINGKYR
jgi:hypothetical protein